MQPIKTVSVVAAVLKNADNKVFIAQRPYIKELGGYWEFPGGKVEPQEKLSHALKRELKEELNIDINDQDLKPLTSFSHQLEQRRLTFSFYLLNKWKGEISLMENQPQCLWVDPLQLPEFKMPDPNTHIHSLICEAVNT